MKTETLLIVSALAIAAGLVLIPRRGGAASAAAGNRDLFSPRVGAGDGATVWSDARTAQYREQLSRETGRDWMGP